MTLAIIFTVLLFLGFVLSLVPMFPGLLSMFVVVLGYGIVDGFRAITPWQVAIFGGLTLLSMIIDHLAGVLGAKVGGASKQALLIGLLGLIVGLVLFPPLGAVVGLFVGIFVTELVERRTHAQAFQAATSSLIGAVLGKLLNAVLGIVMFVWFLVLVF